MATSRGKVLVVEYDPVIGDLVYAVLTDEGYDVEMLGATVPDAIRVAVGRFEPDCVLLDGHSAAGTARRGPRRPGSLAAAGRSRS
jgi:DNA-binding response OmpR family regulator